MLIMDIPGLFKQIPAGNVRLTLRIITNRNHAAIHLQTRRRIMLAK